MKISDIPMGEGVRFRFLNKYRMERVAKKILSVRKANGTSSQSGQNFNIRRWPAGQRTARTVLHSKDQKGSLPLTIGRLKEDTSYHIQVHSRTQREPPFQIISGNNRNDSYSRQCHPSIATLYHL